MKRLEGKSILVAGGGGIGSELARRYALEGAGVVLGDINGDSARKVADEIVSAGGKAVGVQLDGADEASIAFAIALNLGTYGGLDGLHANFASFADAGEATNVLDMPMQAFDDTMRIDARGFVLCTRHALPELIKRGGGAIVYTSSGAAYQAETTRLAYAMAKAASHALMRHVAVRYGKDGVRANCIAPGLIYHSNWDGRVDPSVIERVKRNSLIPSRLGNPTDIASMGALLMSDEGSYITGQIINVDAGMTMRA
jgi:NAD(P)-dependent dehydrogenase (short-subunit alcohol dehydrogenase family)